MTLRVGTSGWQYASWRGRLYPRGLTQTRWLAYYAERFDCVEVNNTFYRLPERETFARWHEEVPDGFVFAVKASRYLTHIRRLREPHDPVHLFLERCEPLGERLGPVLVQLPPTLRVDAGRLRDTLQEFGGRVRVAVETRHPSWLIDGVYQVLADHDAAFVLADRRSRPLTPIVRTASWGFCRMHEGRATPQPCYGTGSLRAWLQRVAQTWPSESDVWVFFNNDPLGCAVRDAARLVSMAQRAGLATTRAPRVREVPAG